MSGFTNYLLAFYSKYFKGSFYVNYEVQGISMMFTMIWVTLLQSKTSVPNVVRVLVGLTILFSVATLCIQRWGSIEQIDILFPIMLTLTRLQVASIQNFGYHINQFLFPVMIRGQAYGTINFISRPFAAFATILVEYTTSPMLYILIFSCASLFFINLIEEPKVKPVEPPPSKFGTTRHPYDSSRNPKI